MQQQFEKSGLARSPTPLHRITPMSSFGHLPGSPRGAPHGSPTGPHRGPCRSCCRLREVRRVGGHVLRPDREQPKPGSTKLLAGLEAIALIGPETATFEPGDDVTGRARQPDHPLPPCPLLPNALALVRVARHNETGGDLVLAHRFAQAREPGPRAFGPHTVAWHGCIRCTDGIWQTGFGRCIECSGKQDG